MCIRDRNNRGGYSRKTEEKDYINFIEMSDYELGLFIKKMFEPCEIRIDETLPYRNRSPDI